MLLVIATLLPHPFQIIVMHLTLEKQQLQQQLTLNLRNCASSLLTIPDYNTVNLPSRNCHKCFLGAAFIIPPIMAAMFSQHQSG